MNFKRRLSLAIMTMCLGVCLAYAQSISPQKDDKKGTWGYVNPTTGKWVVKPKYESAGQLTLQPDGKMKAVVVKNGLTGFVDENGKELGAGIVFEDMTPLQGDAMFVTVKGKKGVANYDGVYLIKPEITEIQPVGDEGYIVTIKDKKGFLAPDGRMTIDPVYTFIDPKTEGYFIVMMKDKMGILKRDGSMILEPKQFTDVEKFGDYWKVSKEDKTGLFKEGQSKLLVKCKYEDVLSPSILSNSPMYPVKKKGLWGLADSRGHEVISCINDAIPVCINKENFVICYREDSGYRLWRPQDGVFLELSSVEINYMGPYIKYWIKKSDKDVIVGYAMSNGASIPEDIKYINWILKPRTSESPYSKSPYSCVEKTDSTFSIFRETEPQPLITGLKEKPEYINGWLLTSNQAITGQGELLECSRYYDKTIFIKNKDDRWYLLTPSGLNTSSPYEEITEPSSYINVKVNGKWGRLHEGKLEIECKYPAPLYDIFPEDGIYKISDDSSTGIININTDDIIIPLSAGYTEIKRLAYDKFHRAKVKKGDVWGVVNCDNGDEIIPVSEGYSEIKTIIRYPIENLCKVKRGDKYGVVNYISGDKIVPPLYDNIELEDIKFNNDFDIDDSHVIKAYQGNHLACFSLDGDEFTLDPHLTTYSYVNDNGHLAFGVTSHAIEGETYEIVAGIYTSGGKYLDSISRTWTPSSLYSTFGDTIWLSGFGRGNYVLKISIYDSKGKSVPIRRNPDLKFYI